MKIASNEFTIAFNFFKLEERDRDWPSVKEMEPIIFDSINVTNVFRLIEKLNEKMNLKTVEGK